MIYHVNIMLIQPSLMELRDVMQDKGGFPLPDSLDGAIANLCRWGVRQSAIPSMLSLVVL